MADEAYVVRTPRQVKQLAYTFKYPEEEDIDADPQLLPGIEAYLNIVEDKVYGRAEDLGEWISIKSFAAWHWAHDVLGTRDTGGANMFFHKKNMLADSLQKSKLKMGPMWDFDSSFALSTNEWCHHHKRNYAFGNELFKRTDFVLRYKQLCDERLQLVCQRVLQMIDSLQATFGDNLDAAIRRHNSRCRERMPVFREQAAFIRSWMEERTQWMAANLHGLTEGILADDDGIHAADGVCVPVRIFTLDGRCVATVEGVYCARSLHLPPGTYIAVRASAEPRVVIVR